jgi:hemerythrin-like domain-containing protein
MNAIELLKQDHRKVIDFIDRLENADDKTGTDPTDTETFNKLNQALKLHSRMEEEVFYPALEGFEETKGLVKEAYREHEKVDTLLAQLSTFAPNQREFQELLTELRSSTEEHINKEENKLFFRAEELCGVEALEQMAVLMEEMRTDTRTVIETMKDKSVSSTK